MNWKNTADRYGAVAKTFHWVIAILILMMLVMGWKMGGLPNGPDKFWVFSLHKSIGITVLGLIVLRLVWKLFNWNLPRPNPAHPKYEHVLAAAVHWGFYAAIIAQPLSGWILTGAANSTINWFGFFPVPNIVSPDPGLKHLMAQTHETIATILWVLIGLHVLGVLKHMFIDRDGTLSRMVPFMAIVLMLSAPALAKDEAPTAWAIDRDHSTLTFEGTQEGSAFKGAFTAFDGQVMLDPKHPETGKARITIDLGSIDTGNEERDSTVKGADWFDMATAPTASYTVSKFEKSGDKDGQLLAMGTLRLRGIEKPVDLPFTITTDEKDDIKTAHVVGDTSLKRLDFGVGAGQWADPKMVGNDVLIHVDLTLTSPKE